MDNEQKFTPGPWEAKPENTYVPAQVWADGRQLCEVYGESRAARQANARLIAAAPELYAALESIQTLCSYMCSNGPLEEIAKIATGALAKVSVPRATAAQ